MFASRKSALSALEIVIACLCFGGTSCATIGTLLYQYFKNKKQGDK